MGEGEAKTWDWIEVDPGLWACSFGCGQEYYELMHLAEEDEYYKRLREEE